ncbi:hypothetical protein PRIPAC_89008 [Pristionchus pacificus]|uniref:Uncharacterized protein n=1 Tax=Pristionchus pacificus TaxID=54126 RepID=A0A2A6B3Z9_PRIPA|nr:hypothetical protein PRIPAC_89008 [Pristionchus pacificus]|eukprot:PDM60594.1 hypothetical protein PRIPAC_53572 [Pristionchus pacificus]
MLGIRNTGPKPTIKCSIPTRFFQLGVKYDGILDVADLSWGLILRDIWLLYDSTHATTIQYWKATVISYDRRDRRTNPSECDRARVHLNVYGPE